MKIVKQKDEENLQYNRIVEEDENFLGCTDREKKCGRTPNSLRRNFLEFLIFLGFYLSILSICFSPRFPTLNCSTNSTGGACL